MGVFSGDTFCVSGAFSISQNEMKVLFVKNGAHIATTPNKSCTYLVADSIGSSKTMKAEKDGIPIVTEEWVQKSIKVGKKSTDASLFLSGGPSGGGKAAAIKASGAKKKSKKSEDADDDEEEEDESTKTLKGVAKSTPTTPFPSFIKNVPGLYAILRTRYDHVEIWVIQNEGNVQAIEEMTQRFHTNEDEEFEYEWLKQNQTEAQARAVVQRLKAGGGGGGGDEEDEDDSEETEVFWIRHPIDLEKLRKAEYPSMIMLDWKDDGDPKGEGGKPDDDEDEKEDEENAKPKKKAPATKKSAAGGGSVFSGETFCVSGSFSVSQAEMRKLIITNGGDVVDTPNKKCTFLVADSIGSSKTMKAQKDGIKIVTEQWVHDSIAKGKKSTDKKYFLSGGGDGGDDMEDEEESKPKKKKPSAKRKAEASEDEEDEDDDDNGPKKKSSKKSAASGPSSLLDINAKIITKGDALVDHLCPIHSTTYVHSPVRASGKKEVYDCMLNQTDIGSNANKFYLIQLLHSFPGVQKFYVWTRWGRVGYPGQNNLDSFDEDLDGAIKSFETKFYEKTKNRWSDRANFESVKGKYTLLERDYSANNDDEEDEDDEDAPKVTTKSKKSNSAPTIMKSILWIDPNNLANNREHLDAIGIDRVESVSSQDEAITWLNAQLKHRPKLLTQIKIVLNMARIESGVFQPQAGVLTTIKLNHMGVPMDHMLIYTSEERAKGSHPPNIHITYEDDVLHKFIGIGDPAAQVNDAVDEDGENGGEEDEDDSDEDEESVIDPTPVPGSIKLNPDPDVFDALFTNYHPAASNAPIGQYCPLCINTVDGARVYLFDARPENRASIQLIEDAFSSLVKHNESRERLEEERIKSKDGEYQFPYYPVKSVEWLVPNEPAKYQTHAEAIARLKELERSKSYKNNHVTVVNSVWNYEKLKKQLSADPLSIDSAVCKNILDYLKPDSVVHSPAFVPRVVDKKYDSYHVVCWNYEDNGNTIDFIDGRPSNAKAIQKIRRCMGESFEPHRSGYLGFWLTQPNQPVSEAEGRTLILRQRISAPTSIHFWHGQFRTRAVIDFVNDGEEVEGTAFQVLDGNKEDLFDDESK